jgi:3-phosphoshikimate 1-carboxyvinyltransferase
MKSISISHHSRKIKTRVNLPGSKSESNRVLILNALSGGNIEINNLSDANDTSILQRALASTDAVIDVEDAGTAMRFLVSYYCAKNEAKTITGSERMLQRPIGPLVDALNAMGFNLKYKGEEGFPPLEIVPVDLNSITSDVEIAGNVSSQFITSLMLIAPFLPNGLQIDFSTKLTSRPYVEMTLNILQHFGVKGKLEEWSVTIPAQQLNIKPYTVGGDWSAASYWYSIAFLADEAEILLEGLKDDWTQGDRELADWMKRFGIVTEFAHTVTLIRKVPVNYPKMMKLNFDANPDLAQTFAAMFAGANVLATFSGLDSLRIKETDRIEALKVELRKCNIGFDYLDMYDLYQLRGEFQTPATAIDTYNDHRMAMAFAPLALLGEIQINNPEVVKKSYPGFWDDMTKAGFAIAEK